MSQRPSHPAKKNKLVLTHNLFIYILAVSYGAFVMALSIQIALFYILT